MGFTIHSTDDNRVVGIEYLPASDVIPSLCRALKQSNGNLVAASGSDVPTYICMCDKTYISSSSSEIIPVIRVSHDIIFETELSAAGTNLKLGDKVTIAADGLRVTATTTDGVAEIVYMEGTAIGSKVRVRF